MIIKNRRLIIGFLLSLLTGLGSVVQAMESTRVKNQTETGFNLNQTAATRILKKYKFIPEDRIDYYADIYNGQQFLLIPNAGTYKFRLKSMKHDDVLQANIRIATYPASCAEGWNFTIKEKAVGELKLSHSEKETFAKAVVRQLDLISTQDSKNVVSDIQRFHQFILSFDVPLLSELTAVPKHGPWYFTASHITKKVKSKSLQNLGWGEIEVSITKGQDYVGSTFIQEKYEVEFQISEPMSVDDFAQSVCAFMVQQHFLSEEIDPTQEKPQNVTLQRLSKFNSALGL